VVAEIAHGLEDLAQALVIADIVGNEVSGAHGRDHLEQVVWTNKDGRCRYRRCVTRVRPLRAAILGREQAEAMEASPADANGAG
jgi:hypothetical protein